MTNLAILHPCIQGHYEDPSLWDFYLQWWPLLLSKIDTLAAGSGHPAARVAPRSSLLVRTLVKFLMTPRLPAGIASWLGSSRSWPHSEPSRDFTKLTTPSFRSAICIPLQPITDAQLYEFSNLISSSRPCAASSSSRCGVAGSEFWQSCCMRSRVGLPRSMLRATRRLGINRGHPWLTSHPQTGSASIMAAARAPQGEALISLHGEPGAILPTTSLSLR